MDALHLLGPSNGELVSGGVQENDYDRLFSNVPMETKRYLDPRRFGGVPTAVIYISSWGSTTEHKKYSQ